MIKVLIKSATLSLLTFFAVFQANAATNKDVEDCGFDSDGKVIWSSTICPQNNSVKQMFDMFPDLTLRAIDSVGLEYGNELISRFIGTDGEITREERKLQIVSYHIRQIALKICGFMAAWLFGMFIFDLIRGDKNKQRHGRLNHSDSFIGILLGIVFIAEFNGFYGFQWLITFAALAGYGAAQYLITGIAWVFQYNTSPQYLDDDVKHTYDATDEATQLTSKEVDIAVCISQLAANSIFLSNDKAVYTYDTPPIFNAIKWSMDGDNEITPMEVFDESDNLIVAYGSGVSSTEITDKDLNPKLCGKERVHQDKTLSDVVDEVDIDYSNAVEVFQRYAAEQLGKDELTTDNELEVTTVDLLRARFFRELMSRYRNPSYSDDRSQAFLMSMKIGEKIRKYNCLNGDVKAKLRWAKSSLSLIKSGSGLGHYSLACVTNIADGEYGLSIGDPQLYFDDSVLQNAEETQQKLGVEIKDDILELNEFHKEMIEPIYNAYLAAGEYKTSDTQTSLIKNLIQQGLMNAPANFLKLAMYTDSKVIGSSLISELKADIQPIPLDDYYLPARNALPDDEVYVSEIKGIPNSYNPSVKAAYSEVGFDNDLYQIMSAKSPLNTSDSITAKIGAKIASMTSSAILDAQAAMGFGYSLDSLKGSDFLVEAINNGWGKMAIQQQFVLRCITNNTGSFNLEMSSDCLNMQRNPLSLERDIGTQIFQAGATLTQSFLIASLTLKAFEGVNGEYGSIGKSKSAYLEAAKSNVSKVGAIFRAVQGTGIMIGLTMMIIGAIFSLVLPYIPVFYMLILNTEFAILIAIGIVGGSVLVPMLFKPRINDGHKEIGEDGLMKLCIHIVVRPMSMFVALVISFVVTSLMMKVAMYMMAGLTEQSLNSATGMNMLLMALLMMCLQMYFYYKVIMFSYSKIPEITNKITQLVKTSGFAISKSFAENGVIMVGAAIERAYGSVRKTKIDKALARSKTRREARESGDSGRAGRSNNSISNGNSIRLKQKDESSASSQNDGNPNPNAPSHNSPSHKNPNDGNPKEDETI
ncbi:hypothetical protein EHJ37_19805 [Vibrio parahaemolyticus]|nr:hypothetical protein [Vibrio parahaemolyticus]